MNAPKMNVDRFLDLAGTVLSDNVTEENLAELNELLLADEASRRCYLNYCLMHVAMRVESRASCAVQKACQQIKTDPAVSPFPVLDSFDSEKTTIHAVSVSTQFRRNLSYFPEQMPLA